ncbi:conserved hypothetical protein [uncultured Gammaproteobacteria bacterium]
MSEVTADQAMRAVEELRHQMMAEIAELKAALATIQTERSAAAQSTEEVSPETLVIMAATITAFLGKKVKIRSARLVQTTYDTANPWAQHGRVFVQAASHDLRRLR